MYSVVRHVGLGSGEGNGLDVCSAALTRLNFKRNFSPICPKCGQAPWAFAFSRTNPAVGCFKFMQF